MKCSLLLILVGIGCALPGGAEEDRENRVPNAGLELGTGKSVEGWKFYSWKESSGTWDDEYAYSGSRSLKLQGKNGGWSAKVPVDPEKVHHLKLRYRFEGEESKLVVYVRETDVSGKLRVLQYDTIPTIPASRKGTFLDGVYVDGADENGWVSLDAGSFVGSENVSEVSLLIKLTSKDPDARMWLDDIEISTAPDDRIPDTSKLLRRLPDAVVWWEDENRKILPESPLPQTEAGNGAVALDLAKAEYGSFQIAVTPQSEWKQVRWSWSDFTGPKTSGDFQLQCRLVEMIPIKEPHGPFGRKGPNPDPLTEKLPCDLSSGVHQAFWFTIFVPAEQAAGTYDTELVLSAGENEQCRIPLSVRVRNFSLPERPSIDAYSGLRASLVRKAEAGDFDTVVKRYYRSYYEHRTRCAPAASVGVRLDGNTAQVDAGKFIEHLKFLHEEFGADRYFLPSLWIGHGGDHKMPADARWKGRTIFSNSDLTGINPAFEEPFRDYMGKLITVLKAEGLFGTPLVRFIDEPNLNDPITVNGIRTLAVLMTQIDPALRVTMTTTHPHPDLINEIKSWTLHTDGWDRQLANIQAARKAGCWISVYNNGVNYPESDPIRIRLWPWLLKKYRVDGSNSWWGTVCWRNGMEDPWNSGITTSGVLLYPPRDETEQGPISSVRWELFRQGLQDFEYLQLAENLAGKLDSLGKSNKAESGRAAVESALNLVEKWPRVQPANDRPYIRDVTAVSAARRALADAIESMQEALEKDAP